MTRVVRKAAIVAAVLTGSLAAAGGDPSDLLMMLTAAGIVDARERSKVDAGSVVFVVLPARGRDLAVFGITRTAARSERLAAWAREVEQLYRGRYIPEVGRFSDVPQLADVAGLMLEDEDLSDLRNCRRGDCAVKLSAQEMQEISAAAARAGTDWKPAVQLAFRKVVVARARAYLEGGFAPTSSHEDHSPRGRGTDSIRRARRARRSPPKA